MPFYNPYKNHHSASAAVPPPQPQQQQQYPPQKRFQSAPQQPQQQYQSSRGQQYPQQQQQQQQQQQNPQFYPQRKPPQQQQQQAPPPQQQYHPQQFQQSTQAPPQPTGSPSPSPVSAASTGSAGGAQAKAGIWAKLKNQITVVTTSGETDGLSPEDTVITNALVKFYTEQKPGTVLPGWLRGSNGSDEQAYTAPPPLGAKNSNSLQEIYNRRSNNTTPVQSQQQQQQQATGGGAPSWRVQQGSSGSNTGSISSASAERYKSKLRSAQRPSMDGTGPYSGGQQQGQTSSRPSWSK